MTRGLPFSPSPFRVEPHLYLGRVRVISRSSGDRTLLQLPQVFSTTSSITDMAVYGNRLAGVTSDGGFVVWELPEVITDDVP